MIYEKVKLEANGAKAELSCYLHDNSKELYDGRKRPCVLICPGGSYRMTSDREAENVAFKFLALGYHAAVLRYAVAPARYPTALLQLAKAAAFLRSRAAEWYIDKAKLVVIGFSAGGHLAAGLGNFWRRQFLSEALGIGSEQFRPNAQVLCYPVISGGRYAHAESFANLLGEKWAEAETASAETAGSEGKIPDVKTKLLRDFLSMEKQVSADTPPTFLWHCAADRSVSPQNSLLMTSALLAAGVPAELHLYGVGGHGLGTADMLSLGKDGRGVQEACANWIALCHTWLGSVLGD